MMESAEPTYLTGFVRDGARALGPEMLAEGWQSSLGDAIRWARRIRAAVLAEYPMPIGTQLTFDDLVEALPR